MKLFSKQLLALTALISIAQANAVYDRYNVEPKPLTTGLPTYDDGQTVLPRTLAPTQKKDGLVEPRPLNPFDQQLIDETRQPIVYEPSADALKGGNWKDFYISRIQDRIENLLTIPSAVNAKTKETAKIDAYKMALNELRKSDTLQAYINWLKQKAAALETAIVPQSLDATEAHQAKIQAIQYELKDVLKNAIAKTGNYKALPIK